ncbi:MAG TPA: DJ-1/PfpI family protein, partial [Candidatus Binatia bacterium]
MPQPKVLILTGDAAESLEVMYPYQRLKEEGYEVHIAAPSKKKLRFVVHDFEEGYDTYTEKPGYSWDADLAFLCTCRNPLQNHVPRISVFSCWAQQYGPRTP